MPVHLRPSTWLAAPDASRPKGTGLAAVRPLLLLALIACRSFPASARFSQSEDDVMLTADPRWLRADAPLLIQLHFPAPVDPAPLTGVSLRQGGTGARLPLRVLDVHAGDVALEVQPGRARVLAYDAPYTLELDGSVADTVGRTFGRAEDKNRAAPLSVPLGLRAPRMAGGAAHGAGERHQPPAGGVAGPGGAVQGRLRPGTGNGGTDGVVQVPIHGVRPAGDEGGAPDAAPRA